MNRWYFLLIILCCSVCAKAQYNTNNANKKAQALYNEAQSSLDNNNLPEAMAYLDMATKADSSYFDAWAQLGSIYLKEKNYLLAVKDIARALQIDSSHEDLYYQYAKALAGTGKFQQAIDNINCYLQINDLPASSKENALQWKDHFTIGLQSLQQNHPFNPINLGDSINTADPEYFPSLTVDQKTLLFTRNLQNRNEDFFISQLDKNGNWSKAINIGPPVNTAGNEGTAHISQDGSILLFAGCNRADGYGSCDIFYSVKTNSGWSQPQNIGDIINSPAWESQPCLSPDNKDLYFVSNRSGGFGGSDIYVSHLQNGHWSKPENLGANINTSGDESSPFIHADNQTLYFASNGWPGVGNVDLFYSRKNADGTWGKPVNLGYPINTIDHDGSLFIAAGGKTAYYASERGGSRGQLDIYQFELYKEARPLQTLYVQGIVYDSITQQRLTANIDLIDLDSQKIISQINSNNNNGEYLITLPVGKDYAFNVSKPGYLFYSANFSLKGKIPYTAFHLNIPLQPIAVNARVILKNIFFGTNQYNLLPASTIELDKVVKLMQQNPTLKIQVNGYTDNVGQPADNLILSQKRSQSVIKYLESRGIDSKRLAAKGFGENNPVADNSTEEGRAQNRRTELVIVAK